MKNPPKIYLVFIALLQEFQRDVTMGRFEILTPHFLPTGCCFSQQPTGRSHKCIFSPLLFIFVKGNMAITVIAAKLVGGYGCGSLPLNPMVLLPWNSPISNLLIFTNFLLLLAFPLAVNNVLFQATVRSVTARLFCLPYTWLSSFSSPFRGVLVSSVHMTRIVQGSWPMLMCILVFASWVIELPQLPLVNVFFYLGLSMIATT